MEVPVSQFNWDRYFKRGPYADGKVEGVDYVRCRECSEGAPGDRGLRLLDHVKKVHGLTKEAYLEKYPGAPLNVSSTLEKRKATVSERYDGVTNVFQVPEVRDRIREVLEERYGGTGHGSPELRARIELTNEARYGSGNPFGSPKIQEKIRETWRANYNCDNPNQSPEVMGRRVATNRERYNVDHYPETEEFRAKFLESSRERFGTDHPMQSKEGKELWESSCIEKYGVRSPLLVPEIQRKVYETNLANHGGEHSQKDPEIREKAKTTWLLKYGTDNPSKDEKVKQRIKDVWEEKYGVPFPPQSRWANQVHSSPNGLERKVLGMLPSYVVYAGDMKYRVRLPGTSKDKYPDFIVLTSEQLDAYRGGADLSTFPIDAVIETFGDFWHGPEITGESREDHYNEVMAFYAGCGIRCLILWENDVDRNSDSVAEKIREFLGESAGGVTVVEEESVLDLFRGE